MTNRHNRISKQRLYMAKIHRSACGRKYRQANATVNVQALKATTT